VPTASPSSEGEVSGPPPRGRSGAERAVSSSGMRLLPFARGGPDDMVREAAWLARCVGRGDWAPPSESDIVELGNRLQPVAVEPGTPLFAQGATSERSFCGASEGTFPPQRATARSTPSATRWDILRWPPFRGPLLDPRRRYLALDPERRCRTRDDTGKDDAAVTEPAGPGRDSEWREQDGLISSSNRGCDTVEVDR
jgi:hypothetical protein